MSNLNEIGEMDGWRCWLCDMPVDRNMPSNDPRAASVDTRITKARAKKLKKDKTALPAERLAHVGCNTGKGAKDPIIEWPDHLIVVEPAPIFAVAERLERKGGRETMARCATLQDAESVAEWLADRMSRLSPGLNGRSQIDNTAGAYLVSFVVS